MHGYEFFDAMTAGQGQHGRCIFARHRALSQDGFGNHGYRWATSNLHERLMTLSGEAMQTRHFSLPPRIYVHLS